jgi:hypothetical protein
MGCVRIWASVHDSAYPSSGRISRLCRSKLIGSVCLQRVTRDASYRVGVVRGLAWRGVTRLGVASRPASCWPGLDIIPAGSSQTE